MSGGKLSESAILSLERTALRLGLGRKKGLLSNYPLEGFSVDTLDQAYSIQASLVTQSKNKEDWPLGSLCGWKGGATNVNAYTGMGLQEPFRSPLFSSSISSSSSTPSSLPSASFPTKVEAEFGFILNDNILSLKSEGKNKAKCDESKAWSCVEEVVCCLEVLGTRVDGGLTPKTNVYTKIADFGLNHSCITGSRTSASSLTPDSLGSNASVKLSVNGEEKASGSGDNVLGHPLKSLAWLVNHLAERDISMKPGHLVMSGAACVVGLTEPSSVVEAEFSGLGSVKLCF